MGPIAEIAKGEHRDEVPAGVCSHECATTCKKKGGEWES